MVVGRRRRLRWARCTPDALGERRDAGASRVLGDASEDAALRTGGIVGQRRAAAGLIAAALSASAAATLSQPTLPALSTASSPSSLGREGRASSYSSPDRAPVPSSRSTRRVEQQSRTARPALPRFPAAPSTVSSTLGEIGLPDVAAVDDAGARGPVPHAPATDGIELLRGADQIDVQAGDRQCQRGFEIVAQRAEVGWRALGLMPGTLASSAEAVLQAARAASLRSSTSAGSSICTQSAPAAR